MVVGVKMLVGCFGWFVEVEVLYGVEGWYDVV